MVDALGLEVAVGAGWAVAGFALFQWLVGLARRRNLLDLD